MGSFKGLFKGSFRGSFEVPLGVFFCILNMQEYDLLVDTGTTLYTTKNLG